LGLDCSAAFVAVFVLLWHSRVPPLLQVMWRVSALILALIIYTRNGDGARSPASVAPKAGGIILRGAGK
jgi:hypothetical protein